MHGFKYLPKMVSGEFLLIVQFGSNCQMMLQLDIYGVYHIQLPAVQLYFILKVQLDPRSHKIPLTLSMYKTKYGNYQVQLQFIVISFR